MHPPILGPWATDPKGAQFWGCNIEPPILGPSGVTCPFSVLRPSRSVAYPYTNRYPTYGSQTHAPWGGLKLNSFFSFPIPHTGGTVGVYTKETQPMAREPTYGSRATHPPHWGSTRTEPDLQRHPYTNEAKEQVQFWSVPRWIFTTLV